MKKEFTLYDLYCMFLTFLGSNLPQFDKDVVKFMRKDIEVAYEVLNDFADICRGTKKKRYVINYKLFIFSKNSDKPLLLGDLWKIATVLRKVLSPKYEEEYLFELRDYFDALYRLVEALDEASKQFPKALTRAKEEAINRRNQKSTKTTKTQDSVKTHNSFEVLNNFEEQEQEQEKEQKQEQKQSLIDRQSVWGKAKNCLFTN